MKNLKKTVKVILSVCLLLSMTIVGVYANNPDWDFATKNSENKSSGGSPVNYVGALDADGELIAAAHAVALVLNDGGALVFAGTGVYHEDAAQYVWTSEDGTYAAEPMEILDSMNLLVFSVSGGGADASALVPTSTYENEKGVVVFMDPADEDGKLWSSEIVSVALDFVDDYPVVQLNGVPSNMFFPAAALDNDGYCTGIVYDSSHMLSLTTTEENFYGTSDSGNGGGSGSGGSNRPATAQKDYSTYIIIGVIVVAAVIIIIFSKKNKKQQPTPQPMPQPMAQPMPQPMMQPTPPTQPVMNPQPQAQISHLYAIGGTMNGRLYPLTDEIIIGRDASCAVRFPADAKGVSRIHCKLFWQNGTLMLMDMNSSYGTFTKNGKLSPMQPIPLKAGDVFYIAEKNNQFKIQ